MRIRTVLYMLSVSLHWLSTTTPLFSQTEDETFERRISSLLISSDENRSGEILSHGERVVPVLRKILSAPVRTETDNYRVVNSLLILQKMPRDAKRLRPIVREQLVPEKSLGIRQAAAQALGAIGTLEDVEILLSLLDDANDSFRRTVFRTLGRIGDSDAATKIEVLLDRRAMGLTAEEIQNDCSFREGIEAVAKIRYRALVSRSK